MCSKFMPQMPAKAVATAKIAAHAASRLVTSPSSTYAPTWDRDGVGSPNQATVAVDTGDINDVDFGYWCPPRGSIGDRVWADADSYGVQELRSPEEHCLRIFDGRNGALRSEVVFEGGTWVPVAAPIIAADSTGTRLYVAATLNSTNDGVPGVGDTLKVYRWSVGAPLGRADWPMFRDDRLWTGGF